MKDILDKLQSKGMAPILRDCFDNSNLILGKLQNLSEYEMMAKKYQEAGFTLKNKKLSTEIKIKGSPFLSVELRVWTSYWRGHRCYTASFSRQKTRKRFLRDETINEHVSIPLLTPNIYGDDVPEQILDTMIKNKSKFNHYYILLPEQARVTVDDPVLLGSYDAVLPYERNWFAILGVWGTDWYELNLFNEELEKYR